MLAQRDPIIAVHVRHIEPIAIAAPDFVEDLVPFFGRHAIDGQAGGRNRLAALVTLRRCIVKTKALRAAHEDFRSIARQ